MEDNVGIRLNKYLSEAGVCSRREADRLVDEGAVTVNGITATQGIKVLPDDVVAVRGVIVGKKEQTVVIALYKPQGVVCTTKDEHAETNVVDFVGYPKRIYPVGRLDKDSEGLILLTNDGELMDEILRSRNGHEKEYEVKVNKPITPEFIEAMSKGVYIEELNERTRPCKVKKTGVRSFTIILTQGLNRQIRRMCKALGYRVVNLKRVRVMNITLAGLSEGKWRELNSEEINLLRHGK